MIRRALRQQVAVNAYMESNSAHTIRHFHLTHTEWRQLEYLSELLAPFYTMTMRLSELDGPTVHRLFDIYDTLFDHIEYERGLLSRKRIAWKVKLQKGLDRAHDKLREYYSQTYETEGYIYAIATILNPATKLSAFKKASWLEDGVDWADKYHTVFVQVFELYKKKNPHISVEILQTGPSSRFDRASEQIRKRRRLSNASTSSASAYTEVQTYLTEGTYNTSKFCESDDF